MDNWRYNSLKEDIKQLRDDLREVDKRTWKVERWQSLVSFRIWLAACWLIIIGIWVAVIADAVGGF